MLPIMTPNPLTIKEEGPPKGMTEDGAMEGVAEEAMVAEEGAEAEALAFPII